jgi:hypothetical protein
MPEGCILGLKPALRLEWQHQNGEEEAQERQHCRLTLSDFVS